MRVVAYTPALAHYHYYFGLASSDDGVTLYCVSGHRLSRRPGHHLGRRPGHRAGHRLGRRPGHHPDHRFPVLAAPADSPLLAVCTTASTTGCNPKQREAR